MLIKKVIIIKSKIDKDLDYFKKLFFKLQRTDGENLKDK